MTGMSSIENGDTTVEDNAPCAKKDKVEFGKKEKQQLLIKAVKALEDSTWPNDDASTFSSTWEVLFRKLDPNQQLFANKTNMEVLYQGTLGRLNENSHQMFNVPNTRCSSTPFSYSDNSSTCFHSRTLQPQVQHIRLHRTVQPQQYQKISSINIQPQETINTQQYGNSTEYQTFTDLLNDSEYS
nr:uncharacterized protein LOC118683679 isoform X1 [Bactrocera oleae]